MKKTVLSLCLSLLILLTPVASLLGLGFLSPSVYDESFVGVLDEKYDRLVTTEKSKIIVIGGSSVAFGLNSELLAEETGKEVVNFGLYAALGTEMMMELSKDGIRRGDTVILMPEPDEQTMSLYFGAEMAWKAIEEKPTLFFSLSTDDKLSMLGALYNFVKDKCAYLRDGKKSKTGDIYTAESFNAYGDVSAQRLQNTMAHGVDTAGTISLCADLLSPDFVDYMKDYISFCEKKGATVYFGWCPMNASALADTSESYLSAYENLLKETFPCTFLGSIRDAVMDAGYFYDTNFHLNSIGAENHTLILARDYWAEKGVQTDIETRLLEAPELPASLYEIDVENPASLSDFILEAETWHNSATGEDEFCGYRITGLTEEGKTKKELTIPVAKDGLRVCYLASGALAGGAVETLILPADLSMGQDNSFTLENGFADGASHLSTVRSYVLSGNEVRPPDAGFWLPSLTLEIPAEAENYTSYNWSKISGLKVKTVEKP